MDSTYCLVERLNSMGSRLARQTRNTEKFTVVIGDSLTFTRKFHCPTNLSSGDFSDGTGAEVKPNLGIGVVGFDGGPVTQLSPSPLQVPF